MKIDLTELLRQVGNDAAFEAEEKLRFAEDGLVLTRPVKADLHFINTGSTVLVDGTISTEVEQECARCLKIFQSPFVVPIEEEYTSNSPELNKNNVLDIDETIRQNLLLALPIKPLCDINCSSSEVRQRRT